MSSYNAEIACEFKQSKKGFKSVSIELTSPLFLGSERAKLKIMLKVKEQNLKQEPVRRDASSTTILKDSTLRSDFIWNGELQPLFLSVCLPQVVYLLLDFAVHTTAGLVSVTEGAGSKTLSAPSVKELRGWFVQHLI